MKAQKKVLSSTESIKFKFKVESLLKLRPLLYAHISIERTQSDVLTFNEHNENKPSYYLPAK